MDSESCTDAPSGSAPDTVPAYAVDDHLLSAPPQGISSRVDVDSELRNNRKRARAFLDELETLVAAVDTVSKRKRAVVLVRALSDIYSFYEARLDQQRYMALNAQAEAGFLSQRLEEQTQRRCTASTYRSPDDLDLPLKARHLLPENEELRSKLRKCKARLVAAERRAYNQQQVLAKLEIANATLQCSNQDLASQQPQGPSAALLQLEVQAKDRQIRELEMQMLLMRDMEQLFGHRETEHAANPWTTEAQQAPRSAPVSVAAPARHAPTAPAAITAAYHAPDRTPSRPSRHKPSPHTFSASVGATGVASVNTVTSPTAGAGGYISPFLKSPKSRASSWSPAAGTTAVKSFQPMTATPADRQEPAASLGNMGLPASPGKLPVLSPGSPTKAKPALQLSELDPQPQELRQVVSKPFGRLPKYIGNYVAATDTTLMKSLNSSATITATRVFSPGHSPFGPLEDLPPQPASPRSPRAHAPHAPLSGASGSPRVALRAEGLDKTPTLVWPPVEVGVPSAGRSGSRPASNQGCGARETPLQGMLQDDALEVEGGGAGSLKGEVVDIRAAGDRTECDVE